MNKIRENVLKSLFLMGFCLLALPTMAQEIEVDAPDEVLESETFQIQYKIYSSEAVKQMPTLLDAKDYDLLTDPEVQQSRPSLFWDRNYYTLMVVYTLKAKKTGKLKLPRIQVAFDGKKITSEGGYLKVIKTPTMDDVKHFVKVLASKKTMTLGDTLTLEYKLYSTKEIAKVLNMDLIRSRSFNYQNVTPRGRGYTEEEVDGTIYKVYTIAKYILQARSLGIIEFPETELHIEYTFPTGRAKRDAWGRTYEEELREVRTCLVEPLMLRVHNMTVI